MAVPTITIDRLAEINENEIHTQGVCNTRGREDLLEEALRLLQEHPTDWLKDQYMGIKRYAGFGDQRSDHPYGYGPKHGSIIFEIGRGHKYDPAKIEDYIQFLLFFRDFRPVHKSEDLGLERNHRVDLDRVLSAYSRAKRYMQNAIDDLQETFSNQLEDT